MFLVGLSLTSTASAKLPSSTMSRSAGRASHASLPTSRASKWSIDQLIPCRAHTIRIRNPLVDISKEQLLANVHDFAKEHQLEDVEPLLVKGALVAQSPALFEELEELDENDRSTLREEITHRFKLPRTLYFTIILNSIAAAIQGWDQTGSNGANLTFGQALGIPDSGPQCEQAGTCEKNAWIIGFINACPYIAIAVFCAWISGEHYQNTTLSFFFVLTSKIPSTICAAVVVPSSLLPSSRSWLLLEWA